ncbi:MAG: hypothetical protein ACI88A_003627 [Paraglaciecola sp.]|jgi:hypothetical protein
MKPLQTSLLRVFILCASLVWPGIGSAAITEVTASVDKNPVMLDESITLSIIANGDADRNAFDPSPLLSDFVVGRTSISSQTQMVNFNTTRTTVWNTVLIPKKQGRLTIPSFTIEGKKTQAIILQVIPVSAAGATAGRDIFITTKVDMSEAYLQQQIRYTLKLHLAKDLQRGSLASPALENADIRQIGKDAEYNEIVDGRRYRIIERNFAIIPQQSGKFIIEGPLFEGEIVESNRQNLGFFNRSKSVTRVGPSQEITILPIPDNYSYHWLPSDYVALNEEWQSPSKEFTAGEPITRTITLTAVGLVEEQLPEINSQYPSELKTYPDQPSTATVEKDNTLIAQRTETIAIIPSQAGKIEIPEVSIPWFNILTKKIEYAQLPSRTIDVLPSLASTQTNYPAPVQIDPSTIINTAATIPNESAIISSNKASVWSVSSWILLALWVTTLFAWGLQFKNAKIRPSDVASNQSENQYWRKLEQALSSEDPQRIFLPLSHWLGEVCGNSELSLPKSQQIVNSAKLTNEIDNMLSAKYAKYAMTWSSRELATELNRIRQAHRHKNQTKQNLKKLYPQVA